LFYALLVAHVLLTTAGYMGLIAANAYLLFSGGIRDAQDMREALAIWRRSVRAFGPLLGVGVLVGFGLAVMLHVPLGSTWLVVTYVFIVVAMGIQGGVMVPWQIRAGRNLATGTLPALGSVRLVLATLSVVYTAIIGLMIVRPG
jgi:hypothetical protein